MENNQALKLRWEELTADLAPEISAKWWSIVETTYEKSDRYYHNLHHINDMFIHFDSHKRMLKSPQMVSYAIFFHDLVYDPKSPDRNEEDSADLFKKFAGEAAIAKDSPLYDDVIRLVLLTKTHLTEEHKEAEVYGQEDFHYFLDFDMAILGSSQHDYDEYASKIKKEYGFLAEQTYNVLRAKVLKSFLQIPNIFATKDFRDGYESKAKVNIRREIEILEGKSGYDLIADSMKVKSQARVRITLLSDLQILHLSLVLSRLSMKVNSDYKSILIINY